MSGKQRSVLILVRKHNVMFVAECRLFGGDSNPRRPIFDIRTIVPARVFFFAVLRQNLPYYQIRAAKRPAILPDKRREAAQKRPDKDLARRFYQISIRICATS